MIATRDGSPSAMSDLPIPRRIQLSRNENPFGPSPAVVQTIKDHLDDLAYYPEADIRRLADKIAAREGVAADQIILGENLNILGLYLAANGDSGGEFIYSEPGYTALVDAVAPGGGVVVGVPLNERLENDLPAIAARINARTRAVYLVNPHNPSGTVSDAAYFIDYVREFSQTALVIVDEAYLEFADNFERRTVAGFVRAGARVAVVRTFSKIYGLASLNIGYTVAPLDIALAMKRFGVGSFSDLNRLGVIAANASLTDVAYLNAVRPKITAEREAWYEFFRKHDLRFTNSQGNFVFFDSGHPHAVIAAMFAARGIDIGRSHPPLSTWIRISIGLPDENRIARQVLNEFLESLR